MKVSAILVAAGESSRMGGTDKLEIALDGGTVLEQSILKMLRNDLISELIIVTRPGKDIDFDKLAAKAEASKPIKRTNGGKTRFLSVKNGIKEASLDADYFCIHDAARPFVSDGLITKTIQAAKACGAAASGIRVSDTVKTVDENGIVTGTPDRSAIRAAGTPQVFLAELYRTAMAAFAKDEALDDCEVVESYGHPVVIVDGEPENIKITTTADIKRIQTERKGMRIGHGYDVHRFEKDRKLILGGVHIPFEMGLLGHSDADVLSHAIIDSLLGAAALGDIGRLFPNSDPSLEGVSSLLLLSEAVKRVCSAGYKIANIDATIICQNPKLAGYIDEMRAAVAAAADIDSGVVSVKATTEEGLGFTGEMRGIAAHAVALIETL